MEIKEVDIKEVWKIRHAVMYPNEKPEVVVLEDDATGTHVGLYLGEELVSVISLFEKGTTIQFRKFATVAAQQRKGYGSYLLKYIIELAEKKGLHKIWCNARLSATALYERFGMKAEGESWNKYGIDFIKMEKILK